MRNIFGLVLLCCSLTAQAQFPGGSSTAPTGRFYGKVVDAANKGIEAASVTLVTERMDTASKQRREMIVGGMLTTATGDFSVESIPLVGRYTLRVTGIGYKTVNQAVAFQLPNRNGGGDPSAMMGALDKDLGNIKLEIDDKMLAGVTITASRPLLQLGIDRKVFNVDRNLVSAGGTAIDVMKNVPSVNVDIDGNVTLRNNAPQVFVDGRPTNLTLEQIPADAIESVEIITNPSAKFDASGGTAGILNIVLKKNKRVGYSGNVRANIDSRARVGFGGDINIRQDKINFFAGVNINQRKSISKGATERTTFAPKNSFSLTEDNNTMTGIFGFGRAGFDFFLDNRNTITVSGTMARGNMNPRNMSEIYSDSNYDSFFDSLQTRAARSQIQFRNMGAQASFKHLFPKAGREWTADITYNKGKNENSNNISSEYFGLPTKDFNRAYHQKITGGGNNNNLVFQTDYSNPLSDKSKFEIGARAMIRDNNSATDYFSVASNGTLVPLPGQNIAYESKDKVYAAYSTFTNRIKNFGYQIGLRAESSTYTGIVNSKADSSFNIDFPISLFPSLFLTQKLGETDDLQFNYSRRINRPNFWQLFPFYDISDTLNISRGNPNLNPEFTNSLELSYSKVFKNRDNFIASIYFKNTNNLITRYQDLEYVPLLDDSLLVSSFVNANKSYVTGLELTGRNKLTKWWDLTVNINLFTAKIDLQDQPDQEQFASYFIKINNSFRLLKNVSFQLSGDYQSKIISAPGGSGGGGGRGGFGGGGGMYGGGSASAAQGFIRSNYGVDAAIRFEFLKNKAASVSLSMNDILRTRKYDAHSESRFFVQDIVRRRDPQVARLNFSWRFGKFDASLFKRRNNRAEDGGIDTGVNF